MFSYSFRAVSSISRYRFSNPETISGSGPCGCRHPFRKWTISCLTVNPEGLARFHRIFTPGLVTDYVKNSPYCRFNYQTQHGKVEVVFKMNEAGLSKLQADWLVMVKDALDDGRWAAHRTTENQEGALETIVLGLDYSILLEYKLKGPDEGYVQVWLNKDGTPVSNESGD